VDTEFVFVAIRNATIIKPDYYGHLGEDYLQLDDYITLRKHIDTYYEEFALFDPQATGKIPQNNVGRPLVLKLLASVMGLEVDDEFIGDVITPALADTEDNFTLNAYLSFRIIFQQLQQFEENWKAKAENWSGEGYAHAGTVKKTLQEKNKEFSLGLNLTHLE